MVNSPKSRTETDIPIYRRCAHGLQMPDGNGWCSITMSFCHGCSDNFESGRPKLYKPQGMPKQEGKIVKPRKTKPIKAKAKSPVKSSKKFKPGQTRLF